MSFNSLSGPLETETTLVIASEDPVSVRRRISQLSFLRGFKLAKADDRSLRDVYFDSIGRTLSSKRIAFRLRETSGETIIGLKGEPQISDSGSIERVEIELDWNLNSWKQFLELLSQADVHPSFSPITFDPDRPVETITKSEFSILQERSTQRIVRNVMSMEPGGPILSEMVLDDVSFQVGKLIIHHHEVEVELKSEDGRSSVAAAIDGLMNEMGSELRIWYHSKLTTGQAIVDLILNGQLKPLISSDHSLLPEAYNLINDYLRFESPQADCP